MASEDYFTYPEGPGGSFSAEEWARAKRAEKEMEARLSASCRYLVRAGEKLVEDVDIEVVQHRPRKSKEEEREALAQKLQDVERLAWGYDE